MKIICLLFGHDWGKRYSFYTSRYEPECLRCGFSKKAAPYTIPERVKQLVRWYLNESTNVREEEPVPGNVVEKLPEEAPEETEETSDMGASLQEMAESFVAFMTVYQDKKND